MKVTRYRVGDLRLLAVDAGNYVQDRSAFAARVCDPEIGIEPPSTPGRPVGETGAGEPPSPGRLALNGGQTVSSRGQSTTDVDRGDGAKASSTELGADAVLFLAPEPEYRPPRVVLTVVGSEGNRTPFAPTPVRAAARWMNDQTTGDRVMVDTQAGTAETRVRDEGTVVVESVSCGRGAGGPTEGIDRPRIEQEFVADVAREP